MSIYRARKQGEALAAKYGYEVPTNVHQIAQHLGLRIVESNLGEEVSGLLVTRNGSTSICVQSTDGLTRKRFTIAHELGHYCLGHQRQPGGHLIVDRGYYISRRGELASKGENPHEMEANNFGACLLMPPSALRHALNTYRARGGVTDAVVGKLAADFDVSEQAMTIQLMRLGVL